MKVKTETIVKLVLSEEEADAIEEALRFSLIDEAMLNFTKKEEALAKDILNILGGRDR